MNKFSGKKRLFYTFCFQTLQKKRVNDCCLDESPCNYWCLLFYYKVLPFARWCFFGIQANWLVDTPAIYLDGTIKLSLEVLQQSIKRKAPEMEATRAVLLYSGVPERVCLYVAQCDVTHLQNLSQFELWRVSVSCDLFSQMAQECVFFTHQAFEAKRQEELLLV